MDRPILIVSNGAGQSADRGLAGPLQHSPAAQFPELPAAGARDHHPTQRLDRAVGERACYGGLALAHPNRGLKQPDQLTLEPDHSIGAGHSRAISAPIPLDAPVTTATLCASLPIESSVWTPISITLSEAARSQAAAPAPQPLSSAQ